MRGAGIGGGRVAAHAAAAACAAAWRGALRPLPSSHDPAPRLHGAPALGAALRHQPDRLLKGGDHVPVGGEGCGEGCRWGPGWHVQRRRTPASAAQPLPPPPPHRSARPQRRHHLRARPQAAAPGCAWLRPASVQRRPCPQLLRAHHSPPVVLHVAVGGQRQAAVDERAAGEVVAHHLIDARARAEGHAGGAAGE